MKKVLNKCKHFTAQKNNDAKKLLIRLEKMASAAKKQDMPPPGGYRPIAFARIPAKQYFSGFSMILGYAAVTTGSLYLYYLNCKEVKRHEIEMRSSRLAMYPMLLAERDRAYMMQLRKNRDEETKLMANVPGWEVGTWYGEPVYKNLPADTLVDPTCDEFYIHSAYRDFAKRANLALWS